MSHAAGRPTTRCPFFYAGKARGADVGAWTQACRAEFAAATGASFTQLLLDLVKCFDHVPHDILAREASAVGYPLHLLRLALAADRLPRTVAVQGTYSATVLAQRGVTAGSGLATTELRVLLLRLLKRIADRYPSMKLTAYVDDIAAEAVGTPASAAALLQRAGTELCDGLRALRLTLSATKCQVIASSAPLGKKVAAHLAEFGVTYVERARSLGVGLGAGVRRNAAVQRKRLAAFRMRLSKFAALLRAGLSAARILRTGGTAAFSWGDAVTGVSSATLLTRRRTVAAAASTPTRGKDLNITLILADDKAHQRLDPAFAAHCAPMGQWAEAVWCSWCPIAMLHRSIAIARARIAGALRPWARVRGPAAAYVATAARLGWHVRDATTVVTDRGRVLDLRVGPPCIVRREVAAAVVRWRWKRVEDAVSHLASSSMGIGACVDPLRRLLAPAARTSDWTAAHQASLRSAATNAQWPQDRLHAASLVASPACQICSAAGIAREGASPCILNPEPPRGTAVHRLVSCQPTGDLHDFMFPRFAALRAAMAARARTALGSASRADAAVAEAVDSPPPRRRPVRRQLAHPLQTDSTRWSHGASSDVGPTGAQPSPIDHPHSCPPPPPDARQLAHDGYWMDRQAQSW